MAADIKLFELTQESAKESAGEATAVEKSLHELMERNLDVTLGIRLLGSEYLTEPKHGSRIDTLGIDENNSPAIVEYKRAINQNVINQGLLCMDWLLVHRPEFELLVRRKLSVATSMPSTGLLPGFCV